MGPRELENPRQRIEPHEIVADEHVLNRPPTFVDPLGNEHIAARLARQCEIGIEIQSVINQSENRDGENPSAIQK